MTRRFYKLVFAIASKAARLEVERCGGDSQICRETGSQSLRASGGLHSQQSTCTAERLCHRRVYRDWLYWHGVVDTVCPSLGLTSAECLLQEETIEAACWFGSGSKLQQQQEGLGPWWNNIKNEKADFESETFLIEFLRILPHTSNHDKDQNQQPQQQPAWTVDFTLWSSF
jgi:hypothetical protein